MLAREDPAQPFYTLVVQALVLPNHFFRIGALVLLVVYQIGVGAADHEHPRFR
jgi:hypothetical protein